jgi:hypothetical protein
MTAFEACCNTSSGKMHGPALKLCFFIITIFSIGKFPKF